MKRLIIIFILFFYNSANSEVLNKLEINGNKRVSNETIAVYGDIKLKSDYQPSDVDKILNKLYKTNFFEDIKISFKNGLMKIVVKEYQTINAIQILGEKKKKIVETILDNISLKEKDSFIKSNVSNDINTIKKIYGSIGYNFVTINSKIEKFEEDRVNLILSIDRGKKAKIAKINFIGDKQLSDRRLRDIIVSAENRFWKFLSRNTSLNYSNIELDKRLLSNYYKSIGYYDIQVVSSNAEINKKNETILTYSINPGVRYRINKISTNVDPVLDKNLFVELEDEFIEVVGKYYSPFRVKKLLDSLNLLIANNDLQFVEHSVSEIISDEFIEIKLNIFEGSKELVERINIRGNTITNENVIRSELLLDEGDPYNVTKLDLSIAEIRARNIFSNVQKTIKNGSSKDTKIIDITVDEKPTGEISAGAGVGTNGSNFQFSVNENNWLGRGVRANTFINVSKQTFQGGFDVTDPNYNFTGNSLKYNISTKRDDKPDSGFENAIYTTGIGTKFEQYRDLFVNPGLQLTYDDLKVNDTASKALQKQAGSFTDFTFDYSVSSDKRDRAFMPTDGYLASFGQSIPVYADTPFLKNTVAYTKYNSFSPNLIGVLKFYATAINSLSDEDVRLNKRVKVPSSRLRGFQSGKVGPLDGTDYVGGNYASAVNLEANLPNLFPDSSKIEVGVFLDAGNVWGVDYTSEIDDSNSIRATTGINTSWISPIGPLSFVFSKNLRKAETDKTESFNFRLGTTF